ncbi:hypothetical protein HQ529_04570 [Candidatus Woesearchaeota archaeon]|nr:hypothetical protein [Candidatus Woesearchaeota archaeon]
MYKIKKLFKNVRVIILLIFLALAIVSIHPGFGVDGVAIRSVSYNSSASDAGIIGPKPTSTPMSRERIISFNNVPIVELKDYYDHIETLQPNRSFTLKTNKGLYKLTTNPKPDYFNESGIEDIGLSVYEAPSTNIRKGLDLQGGTRVLLQPEKILTTSDMEIVLDNMKERLNVYGLTDVVVRESKDLSGNQYISVEIAGANEDEVKELLAKQGKFEASVGNNTVFRGGNDVTYVCRTADCSGIDPQVGCSQIQDGWICRFRFSVTLTPEAAQRQADLTMDLEVITENDDQYLSEKLNLFLDDQKVDELNIGAELKGQATTTVSISGSGGGGTRDEAIFDSLKNMKRLQTILITGSLPVKLEIVKTDSVSPILGEEFIKNAILVGLVAILGVAFVVFLRYRKIFIALPMVVIMLSEVTLLLGLAALIGWNLDLAAIAGIIIAVGTGVDHQIVITDETITGKKEKLTSWREQLKKAFFIIMAAYFTTVVAMLPLWFAGAGLLKGFAITTIFGITFGVFITRPAYAAIIEVLLKD